MYHMRGSIGEQELKRLGRADLLELLLEQNREAERNGQLIKQQQAQLGELNAQVERLKAKLADKDGQIGRLASKLDGKDAQIERLKLKLDEKDEEIGRMQAVDLDNPGTLAAAAVKASGILQSAEQAAAQYLEGAKQIELRRRQLYSETAKRCQEAERRAGLR